MQNVVICVLFVSNITIFINFLYLYKKYKEQADINMKLHTEYMREMDRKSYIIQKTLNTECIKASICVPRELGNEAMQGFIMECLSKKIAEKIVEYAVFEEEYNPVHMNHTITAAVRVVKG